MKTIHRQPKKQWELKSIPAFVNQADELISDLDATKLFHEAGQDIGNTYLYKAYRNDLLSAYIINYKRYYIKSEIMAAIKQFPRDVPRKDGYYPCRAKIKAEVERLKTEVEALKGKEQFTKTYKYINIA
jgi:hypothetical protein